MRIIKPKILGTLQIKKAIAGNYIIVNGINKPPNKLIIPCETHEQALEIIGKLKAAKIGDVIYT